MFKVLILPCVGIVVLLQFRCIKESKTYNVNERESSLYIDTNVINKQINNRYEN